MFQVYTFTFPGKNRDSIYHVVTRRRDLPSRSFNVILDRDFAISCKPRSPHLAPPHCTIHYKFKLKIRFDRPECLYDRPRRRFTSKTILSTRAVNMTTLQQQPSTGDRDLSGAIGFRRSSLAISANILRVKCIANIFPGEIKTNNLRST